MVIKIYVNNELKNVCVSEFVAMNNTIKYVSIHGKENVRVERINQDLEDALKEVIK